VHTNLNLLSTSTFSALGSAISRTLR
jgi:hypothetical protein